MYQASAKDRNGRAARSGSRQPSDDGHPTSSDSGNEYVPEVLGSERQKERSTTRSRPNWESRNIEPASSKDEGYATSASSAPQSEDESVPQVLKWETSVAPPERFQLQSKFRKLHNIAGQEHSDSTLFLGELIVRTSPQFALPYSTFLTKPDLKLSQTTSKGLRRIAALDKPTKRKGWLPRRLGIDMQNMPPSP